MMQYKVVTINGGVWTISCDDFEYPDHTGLVRFVREGRNVAIFNPSALAGIIEDDNVEENGYEQ